MVLKPPPPTLELACRSTSSEEEDSLSPTKGEFGLFDSQVSGHMPLITSGCGRIGKPAVPQEVAFYEVVLARHPRLRPFAPNYLGCVDMSIADIEAMGAEAVLSCDDDDDDIDASDEAADAASENLWSIDMEGECHRGGDAVPSRRRSLRRRRQQGGGEGEGRGGRGGKGGGGGGDNAELKAKMWAKFLKRYCRELSTRWEGSGARRGLPACARNGAGGTASVCGVAANHAAMAAGSAMGAGDAAAATVRFMMLEDLTFPFRSGRACILDVKLGTRQYRAGATPEKEQRQRLKSRTTTTGQFGLRLNGMRVWHKPSGAYVVRDKYWGRSIQADTLEAAVTEFFHNGETLRADVIPPLLRLLASLASAIEAASSACRFYSSSVLLIYDGASVAAAAAATSPSAGKGGSGGSGDAGGGGGGGVAAAAVGGHEADGGAGGGGGSGVAACERPRVDVRMIDFANSLCTRGGAGGGRGGGGGALSSSLDSGVDALHPDDGCLLGLTNLMGLLRRIHASAAQLDPSLPPLC
ncbi:hypothetical protein JKP88DRAFT_348404 [Tribonema minus]|uniref:Kinase n=1 Tax=Tribonema minus TaxID=303371 RepID=A0A835Z2E3_9STRA|nr:hypothetical protein JKP88DRAFT_348404 [Tribonema minus]